jgi:hypothetical protein
VKAKKALQNHQRERDLNWVRREREREREGMAAFAEKQKQL